MNPALLQDSLETILLQLCDFGRPRLSVLDNGWHCAVELRVSVPGTECVVRSEFNLRTPTEAAQQALTRARAVTAHHA